MNAQRTGRHIALVTDKGVYYISAGKSSVVADVYPKAFIDYDEFRYDIGSARMLTDNIVRIKYANDDRDGSDGMTAHWRIKLTREDCEKNLRSASSGPGKSDDYTKARKMRASVIWADGKAGISVYDKAWDFDPDTSREPGYGQ